MRQIRSIVGPICHVGFLSHHLYVFGYAHKIGHILQTEDVVDHRISDLRNFSALFFTNWNLIIQTIYFALAMALDILNITSKYPRIKTKIDQWKGFLFTSFVFPCSVFVFAMFWGVFSIDRELVLPEICDQYIPSWLNHSMHTNVLLFLIVEVLISNQLLPTFKSAFTALTILTVIYDVMFFIAYFVCGRFAYGLFHVFSWPERIGFVLFNYVATVVMMRIGIAIENVKYSLAKRKVKSAAD